MISIRRSEDRGHFDHGWLDTFHTFSFADYMDPEFMGFSKLRVLNQDRVRPGEGFGTHGHRNMEIISYALEGVLEHKDSMGNGSRILPGDVQFMSAGSGVTHSEFNGSPDQASHFLQMWVMPAKTETPPRYDQKSFPADERTGRLRLMVSPDGTDDSIVIGQDVKMYGGVFSEGDRLDLPIPAGRSGWLHVATGRVRLDAQSLGPGDGCAILDERELKLEGIETADVIVFDLP